MIPKKQKSCDIIWQIILYITKNLINPGLKYNLLLIQSLKTENLYKLDKAK